MTSILIAYTLISYMLLYLVYCKLFKIHEKMDSQIQWSSFTLYLMPKKHWNMPRNKVSWSIFQSFWVLILYIQIISLTTINFLTLNWISIVTCCNSYVAKSGSGNLQKPKPVSFVTFTVSLISEHLRLFQS